MYRRFLLPKMLEFIRKIRPIKLNKGSNISTFLVVDIEDRTCLSLFHNRGCFMSVPLVTDKENLA